MELMQQIADLKIKIGEKTKYERQFNEVRNELIELTEKESILKDVLIKEEKDVKRLETISFSNIWYSILGNKIEKLDKEKREFSKAEYDYKLVVNSIKNLKAEILNIKSKLTDLKNCEIELENLLIKKEELIISQNPQLSEKVNILQNQINEKKGLQKEIKEAIEAGNELFYNLQNILDSLTKAKNWGTWDILGGGVIADMVKHSNLDDARSSIENLNYLSKRFTRELKDVNLSLNINIEISNLLTFADYFFDGILIDLTVQSKINKALEQVNSQIEIVNNVLINLSQKQKDIYQIIEKLNEEKKNLVKDFQL